MNRKMKNLAMWLGLAGAAYYLYANVLSAPATGTAGLGDAASRARRKARLQSYNTQNPYGADTSPYGSPFGGDTAPNNYGGYYNPEHVEQSGSLEAQAALLDTMGGGN